MSNIDTTLEERGSRYGDFCGHAEITQGLKEVMQATPNWAMLEDDQKEALEMTAHKIGRILNGDPNYRDSWHDIVGYIRLVDQRLELREKAVEQKGPESKKPKLTEADRCLECGEIHEGAVTLDMVKDLAKAQGLDGAFFVLHVDDELTGP